MGLGHLPSHNSLLRHEALCLPCQNEGDSVFIFYFFWILSLKGSVGAP